MQISGCRSSRNLAIHHMKHRAHGGDHTSGNLGKLCGGHHKLNHDGVISINGDADGELVFTRNGVEIRGEVERDLNLAPQETRGPGTTVPRTEATPRSTVDGVSRYRQVERNSLVKSALKQAGYKPAIAARAVERAIGRVPCDAPLEVLLTEAFRHCK